MTSKNSKINFGYVALGVRWPLHALRKEMGEDAFFAPPERPTGHLRARTPPSTTLETYASTLLGN